MKSAGIQRSINARGNTRTAGDAPNIGRVAKMPGTGLPKGERRHRKRGGLRRLGSRKTVTNRAVPLVVLALLALASMIYFWLQIQTNPSAAQQASMQQSPDAGESGQSKIPPLSESAAMAMVRQALLVREAGQVPTLFRPGSTDTGEIVAFLSGIESTDGKFDHLEWLGSIDANHLPINGVLVYFIKGNEFRQRIAFLTSDSHGVWKVDFESFARTIRPSWSELLEKDADHALVRVCMSEDMYFSGPFKNDSEWACYGMSSTDTERHLHGYCKVGSPQALAMKWIFSKGARVKRATLEVRRLQGAPPIQFEIVRVLAEDWVMGPSAFDAGFH
ncbi:MAG: hypothetical protein ABI600_00945 [Luteolibacter sp.]